MKKIVLALAFVMAVSTCAYAERITCQGSSSFTMEVPKGWAHKIIDGGCLVAKIDGSAFISVAYYNAKGLNAYKFADKLIDKMKITPKFTDRTEDHVEFEANIDGTDATISITAGEGDESVQVLTTKGDWDLVSPIFDSVTF